MEDFSSCATRAAGEDDEPWGPSLRSRRKTWKSDASAADTRPSASSSATGAGSSSLSAIDARVTERVKPALAGLTMTSAWKDGSSGKERDRRAPFRLGLVEDSAVAGCSCS